MRWTKPKSGDVKIKRKFAILPVCVGREARWLEWVTVKYLYRDDGYGITGWRLIQFVDDYKEV